MASGPSMASSPHHANLDAAETRCRRAMANMCHLAWLSLATVRGTPHGPLATHGVATVPEARCDARVGGVFQHSAELPVANLPRDLDAELEIQPLVVNAPAFVRLQKQPVV